MNPRDTGSRSTCNLNVKERSTPRRIESCAAGGDPDDVVPSGALEGGRPACPFFHALVPSGGVFESAVEEIMQMGGWKTESVAKYYAEPSSKRQRAASYTATNEEPLSPAFEADFAACARRKPS